MIASRFGAGGEVVSNGIDGFTVDPINVAELAQCIITMLSDKSLARGFAAAGQAKVIANYSADAFTMRLSDLTS